MVPWAAQGRHIGRRCSVVFCIGVAFVLLVGQRTGMSDEQGGTTAADRSVAADPEKLAFFESKIRPVLIESCYECHSGQSTSVKGGLFLDSRAGVIQGGDSGPAIVTGKPTESLLVEALKHESFEMPPDRRLPAHVISDFETWIRDGAVDPRDGAPIAKQKPGIDMEQGRRFWSFQPVQAVDIPQVAGDWAVTDIDRLIAARWQAEGVQPADEATPHQIARRFYFILSGLPPTADQLNVFATAYSRNADGAVESLVDELLQSPRFGERWGRHWLDVTRYAESSGGGRSLMFPDAWRFRDYVINSFNNDKPYDRMIREHLAGDLLPSDTDAERDDAVVGSGYLVLGAINYEEQDKESLRMDVIDEQISTLGETFLGMTLGCARCHDHKFDPIPTRDYYAMAGIFRSTRSLVPGNVSGYVTTTLRTGLDQAAMDAWKKEDARLAKQIRSLNEQLGNTPDAATAKTVMAAGLPGIVVDDDDAVFEGVWVASSSLAPFVNQGYHHSASPRTGIKATYTATVPADGDYIVRMSHNSQESRPARVPVLVKHAAGTAKVEVNQQKAANADGVFSELGRYRFTTDEPAEVTILASDASPGYVIVDAVQFISADSVAESGAASAMPEQSAKPGRDVLQTRLAETEKSRKEHEKKKPSVPTAMCVADEQDTADWHVHIRGDTRNLGEIVPRGFLTVATPEFAEAAASSPWQIPEGTSGRLQLAEWVASKENPLTARVFVNRVWQHVMGEGLVRTPDQFGSTGTPPTHPELLDHLAWQFMHQDNWSVKRLVRRICLSRVIRLSSDVDLATRNQDPDNTLLTRGFRRRIEAEALRDSMLTVSGQLDLSCRGGLTIGHITTYDNEYDHVKYASAYRSVYVPFLRNSMLTIFDVFDVANPNLVTGRRNHSTLPAQALYLMNSPFVVAQAEHAATNFLQTASADSASIDANVQTVWMNALGRQPTQAEQQHMRQYLQTAGAESPESWAAVFQALFGSVDFRYLD